MVGWQLDDDLEAIMDQTQLVWPSLKGGRLFITGGTGFIGCWLLESLRYANVRLDLEVEATILTRSKATFRKKVPHLADYDAFNFIEGDVSDFSSPDGRYSHIIHAATDASAFLNEHDPLKMFSTIIDGNRRVLDFAVEKNAKRVLFLSSGAVYGQQPSDMVNVPESWFGGPSTVDPKATYAEAKRAAEMLCSIYQKQFGLEIAISRIFALLGPYLSLGIHFAAGNFIQDAMLGKKVIVNGSGLPCRSYLYASDLTVWLWNMLVRADSCKPYNCGSNESVSVKELAERVSAVLADGEYEVLGAYDRGWNLGRYVPDVNLISKELGLKKTVTLDQAIIRTALWNGWKGKSK